MADETKVCSNCKRDISAANFVMHEMHCRRHIVLCEHCSEPIPRSELDQHFNDHHAQFPCEKCQEMVTKSDMAKHLTEDCTRKLIRCEYCDLSLPKNEMETHVNYCGTRTESCPICQQYIMLRDKLRHESSGCTFPEAKPQYSDPYSIGELEQMMTNAVLGNNVLMTNYRRGKFPTNKKSELNAQRAKNVLTPEVEDESFSTTPSDVDYDSMLALQLAHEDWLLDGGVNTDGQELGSLPGYPENNHYQFEDFGGLLDGGGELWSDLASLNKSETTYLNPQAGGDHVNASDDEDMSIPCEFCETEVPLSAYILHMESCPIATQSASADLNNEQVPFSQITSRTTIPVINNLRPADSLPLYHQLLDDDDDDDEDDVMLPCEFCQETFPSDMIIQHQSVCQADEAITTHSTEPERDCRNITPQLSASQISVQPISKSPAKRLNDSVEFIGQSSSNDLGNGDLTSIRVQKSHESSSNKYSPAYNRQDNRFDEAVTRPPRRSSKRTVTPSGADSLEATRESKSVQRTRASLNQLLEEEAGAKDKVDKVDVRRKPVALGTYDTNRAEASDRRTRIDSRTVRRELRDSQPRPAQSSSKTSASENVLSSGRGDQTWLTQSRQRTDHLFSPELRLKPGNSCPPKKR